MTGQLALWIIVAAIALFSLFQGIVIALEYYLRWKRFRDAARFAREHHKPLLVIGRPGTPVRIYGCGDACLDADPQVMVDCPDCGIVGDIREIPFEDGHFAAAFCSHIVEFLPSPADAEKAMREMSRVAGRVFLCYTLPANLIWRWFGPTTRLWMAKTRNGFSLRKRPW